MKHGENHVITGNVVIVWDGITRPDKNDSGDLVHKLKVAFPNNAPEYAELYELAMAALKADSKFKGNLPPGGVWPMQPVDPNQFEGKLPAHQAFSAKTYRGAPQVFDANGQELSPMVYGPMLYPGAVVRLIVHAYTFDNKSKGVAFGLDGIQIVDAQAPRLDVGGVDAGAAFGATGKPAGATAPPAPGQPAAGGYPPPPGAPAAAPAGPPGYQAPPAPGVPAGVAPAPDFLNPPGGAPAPPSAPAAPPAPPAGPVMTAKAAGQSYEAFIAAGWNDDQLRANGYMQ